MFLISFMTESTGGETSSLQSQSGCKSHITSYHILLKNSKYYNFPALCLLVTPPSGHLTLPVSPSFPGTTCLVALLSDKELTVANVGDSRGVLCDKNGNAVPLSHDHKPYQLKERKRIKKAGEKMNESGPDRRTLLS